MYNSEKSKTEAFRDLSKTIKEKLFMHKTQLEFFSILMNSVSSLNECLTEISEIAKEQKKIKVFRFWLGYKFFS